MVYSLQEFIINQKLLLAMDFFVTCGKYKLLLFAGIFIVITLVLFVVILKLTINKRTLELEKALTKAKESDQLKSVFLRNLSHEIRTPLNGISGFSLLLQDDDLAHKTRVRYTDLIISSGRQLMAVVDNILAASLLETRQEKINLSKVNINDVIDDLYSVYIKSVDEKGIEFTVHKEFEQKQAFIKTDFVKLNQILDNLLSNAVKFTAHGFIQIGYLVKGEFIEFFVKDSGVGINSNKHDKIFVLFSQEDNSSKRRYEGAGLGLSISKGYVELLGGEMHFDSEKDKGTSFYFTIPIK